MKIQKNILSILVIIIGVFLFVYAEIKDSPGGQLVGMVVVIGAVLGLINRGKKKK